MPHVNKKTTTEEWKSESNKKLGLEWTMNGFCWNTVFIVQAPFFFLSDQTPFMFKHRFLFLL